jgi:hypothetical protein
MSAMTKESMDQKQEEGFQSFMKDERNKLLISQIPEGQSPETLRSVLRAAYDSGHGNGVATVMVGLLESMFKDRQKP